LRKKQVDKKINSRILKKSLGQIEDKSSVKILDLEKYEVTEDVKNYYKAHENVIL